MRHVILTALVTFTSLAMAENISILLEATPAETTVGKSVKLTVTPRDANARYRYEGLQLNNGSVPCNDSFKIAGNEQAVKWTTEKSGSYQITVTQLEKGLSLVAAPKATAAVKVNPRKVNLTMINPQPGKIVLSASPGQGDSPLPVGVTYKWSLTVMNSAPGPGNPPFQNHSQQTSGPMAIFNVPGTPWAASVNVSLGTPCSVVAAGVRPPSPPQ